MNATQTMTDNVTTAERAMLAGNRCPDCLTFGLLPGPRGGAAQNVYCNNAVCRSAFDITRYRGEVVFAERINTYGFDSALSGPSCPS